MYPVWVYVAVALFVAIIGFGIGQVWPGLGVTFVALASTLWTAYSVNRHRKLKRTC